MIDPDRIHTIKVVFRLEPTGSRFHHACKDEQGSYVHNWQMDDIYERNDKEYVVWYCTRCREVRHDLNGAPSY